MKLYKFMYLIICFLWFQYIQVLFYYILYNLNFLITILKNFLEPLPRVTPQLYILHIC